MRYYERDLGDPKLEVPIFGFEQRCCGLKGFRESDIIAYWDHYTVTLVSVIAQDAD